MFAEDIRESSRGRGLFGRSTFPSFSIRCSICISTGRFRVSARPFAASCYRGSLREKLDSKFSSKLRGRLDDNDVVAPPYCHCFQNFFVNILESKIFSKEREREREREVVHYRTKYARKTRSLRRKLSDSRKSRYEQFLCKSSGISAIPEKVAIGRGDGALAILAFYKRECFGCFFYKEEARRAGGDIGQRRTNYMIRLGKDKLPLRLSTKYLSP